MARQLAIPTAMLLTLAVVVTARGSNEENNALETKPKSLIKVIRRQLMNDNSDYTLQETNSTENYSYERKPKKQARKNFYVSDLPINDHEDRANNFTSIYNKHQKERKKNIELEVSKKDLFYYMDDDKLTGDKREDKYSPTESNAKYKLLKAKHQYRRSEKARIIQEEDKEGISIVNLDKGPVPELSLSSSRRQYMHDHGEVMTEDEEVPPPVVNTSDPEAAADDTGNVTRTVDNKQ